MGPRLERDLKGASTRGEIHIAYQPIVHTGDGRITGFEALMRWTHPRHGVIAPDTLIPMAEQTGLIGQLGSWVLQWACMDLLSWQAQSGPELGIAVNVSALQLMSAGFAVTVGDVVRTAGVDPRTVTLEVTETVFLADSERAMAVLDELRLIGVRLALDDFGTGYTALNYLHRFPVDILKVDRAFVTDLGTSLSLEVIVAAIVQMAHGLGMTVVAEGVETELQHHTVAELGCNFSQGFYFAEPMPAKAVNGLLKNQIAI